MENNLTSISSNLKSSLTDLNRMTDFTNLDKITDTTEDEFDKNSFKFKKKKTKRPVHIQKKLNRKRNKIAAKSRKRNRKKK